MKQNILCHFRAERILLHALVLLNNVRTPQKYSVIYTDMSILTNVYPYLSIEFIYLKLYDRKHDTQKGPS